MRKFDSLTVWCVQSYTGPSLKVTARCLSVVVDSIWLHMENSLLRHCMDVVFLRFADST